MTSKGGRPAGRSTARTTSGKPAFRRHELTLADGGRLLLSGDGTIRAFGPDGVVAETWRPGEAEWERTLRRFGVEPPTTTITPRRRNDVVGGIRP